MANFGYIGNLREDCEPAEGCNPDVCLITTCEALRECLGIPAEGGSMTATLEIDISSSEVLNPTYCDDCSAWVGTHILDDFTCVDGCGIGTCSLQIQTGVFGTCKFFCNGIARLLLVGGASEEDWLIGVQLFSLECIVSGENDYYELRGLDAQAAFARMCSGEDIIIPKDTSTTALQCSFPSTVTVRAIP